MREMSRGAIKKRVPEEFTEKDLIPSVRFITAINLSAEKYFVRGIVSKPYILYSLLLSSISKEELSNNKKYVLLNYRAPMSERSVNDVKELFWSFYNDDKLLLAYLNGKVSRLSIEKYRPPKSKFQYKKLSNEEKIINSLLDGTLLKGILNI